MGKPFLEHCFGTMTAYKNEEEFLNELRDALLKINGGEPIPQEMLEECRKWITELVMRFLK